MILKMKSVEFTPGHSDPDEYGNGKPDPDEFGPDSDNTWNPDNYNLEDDFRENWWIFDNLERIKFGEEHHSRRKHLNPDPYRLVLDLPKRYVQVYGASNRQERYTHAMFTDINKEFPYHIITAMPRDEQSGEIQFAIQTAAYLLNDEGETLEIVRNGIIR